MTVNLVKRHWKTKKLKIIWIYTLYRAPNFTYFNVYMRRSYGNWERVALEKGHWNMSAED